MCDLKYIYFYAPVSLMANYQSVSLPLSLIREIEHHRGEMGYVSTIEFVKDACRRRLEEVGAHE